MNALIDVVNRMRSQGYKYEQIRERLVKMGNSDEDAATAISAYINEMCGTGQS